MRTAFESEIHAARTWLLDARPRETADDGRETRTSQWGWLQDVRASALNTSEVLIALAGDPRLTTTVFREACDFVIGEMDVAERCTVRHLGWIALALARFETECPDCAARPQVVAALGRARERIIDQQNDDGGWGTLPGERSMVSTTALVLRALGSGARHSIRTSIDAAVTWLLASQNGDGGWGLVPDYAEEYKRAQGQLSSTAAEIELTRSRTQSNAACTAFAMLALQQVGRKGGAEGGAIRRGARWLLKHREHRSVEDPDPSSGGWPVFHERGIRARRSYTFRHFSTAWAIVALLRAGEDPRGADLLEAIEYLRSLQQPPVFARDGKQIEGGGWRCSRDGEPYTWATSNAIMALTTAAEMIDQLKGDEVVDILLSERRSRTASFIGSQRRPWVTNQRTAILVGCVTTVLAAAFVVAARSAPASKSLWFVFVAAAAAVAAAPWSVWIAVRRDPKSPNLLASAGRVYAALAAVLGVLGAAYFG